MTAEHVTDHEARVTLLIERYRKPRIKALLASWLSEVQALEDAFWQLLVERSVANAVGAQLDVLGRIVGQPREGRTDALYRIWVAARVLVSRSSGTTEQMITITKRLVGQSVRVRLEEQYPAAFVLHAEASIDAASGVQIARLLSAAKAAGIAMFFEWFASGMYSAFTFAPSATVVSGPEGFDRGMLAAIGDGSVDVVYAPDPPAMPLALPTSVASVALWMSEFGMVTSPAGAVGAVIDMVNGVAMQQGVEANRPVLGLDGTYFNGRPVLKFTAALLQYLTTGILDTALWPAGAKPWAYVVMRRVSNTGSDQTHWCSGDNGSAGPFDLNLSSDSAGIVYSSVQNAYGLPHNSGLNDALPHIFAHGYDASGNNELRIDGVRRDSSTQATSATIAKLVSVGAYVNNGVPGNFVNTNLALLWLLSAKPTAAEDAAILAALRARYGTPDLLPLPASVSAIGLWLSEIGYNAGSANTWTDAVNGRVMGHPTAGNRPVLGATANFNGRPVLQFSGGHLLYSAVTSDLYAAGTRPYIYAVMERTGDGVDPKFVVTGQPSWGHGPYNMGLEGANGGPTHFVGQSSGTTRNPHIFAYGYTAAGVEMVCDGALTAFYPGAATPAGAVRLISVGALADNWGPASMRLACVLLLSAKPSPAEDAAIFASLRARYGTPDNTAPSPALTPPPPVPTTAATVGLWLSEQGVTGAPVSSLVDVVNGLALVQATAGNRPAIVQDPGYFNNRPVLKFTSGSSTYLSITTALWPVGSRPYVYAVLRRTANVAGYRILWQNNGDLTLASVDGGPTYSAIRDGSKVFNADDLQPHIYANGYTAAGANELVVDGALKGTVGTGLVSDVGTQLSLGCWMGPSGFSDANVVALWVLRAKPSPAEDVAITAWLRARYGTP